MGRLVYASVSPAGDVVHTGSFDDALSASRSMTGDLVLAEKLEPPKNPRKRLHMGKLPTRKAAKKALKRAMLKRVSWTAVRKMSLEEAHERLSPIFYAMRWKQAILEWRGKYKAGQGKKDPRTGRRIRAMEPTGRFTIEKGSDSPTYQSPLLLAKSFLGSNYKMEKQPGSFPVALRDRGGEMTLSKSGRAKVEVRGFSLVPHHLLLDLTAPAYREDFGTMAKFARKIPGIWEGAWSLCAGSNQMCRDSCLVYSGKNWIIRRNTLVKMAKTICLLTEPVATLRMIWEACVRLEESMARGTAIAFVRLNVLQDLPWELIAPWLMDKVGIQFYDYTKVAGRVIPPRLRSTPGAYTPGTYDLTFSFSGTNEAQARKELQRGTRVACVFLGMRREGEESWSPMGSTTHYPFPATFWGRPVVNGDDSDLRPLDPAGSIVALRWKTPQGQAVDPAVTGFSFVTPAYQLKDRVSIYRPNPNGGGPTVKRETMEYLVVAPTARMAGFRYDPVVGPDEEGAYQQWEEAQEYGDIDVGIPGEVGV